MQSRLEERIRKVPLTHDKHDDDLHQQHQFEELGQCQRLGHTELVSSCLEVFEHVASVCLPIFFSRIRGRSVCNSTSKSLTFSYCAVKAISLTKPALSVMILSVRGIRVAEHSFCCPPTSHAPLIRIALA